MEIIVTVSCEFETPGIRMLSVKLWLTYSELLFLFCQAYFYNDDTFNFNYAQAKAALGNYEEAEEVCHLIWNIYLSPDFLWAVFSCYGVWLLQFLFFQYFLLIQNEKFKSDYVYLSWLARCCMYQNLHTWLVHTFIPISPHAFILFPAPYGNKSPLFSTVF